MPQTIRFGPYTIDPDRLILRKHNIRVKLQRQPFKLLLLLLRHKGTVVNRDTMISELWSDGTQVDFDRSLNFCVSQIRAALNDDSASPKYIETVHREGYRFLANVDLEEPVTPPEPHQPQATQPERATPPPSRRRIAQWAAAGIAVAGGAGLLLSRFAQKRTIATPPPEALTGLAGRLSGPAFSPDAKQIAFSWTREDRPNQGEIHVKLIGAAETLQLTSGEALDEFPQWAPDGKSIFFTREDRQRAELWQVPALGGTPKRIAYLGPATIFGYAFRRPFHVLPSGGFIASSRNPGPAWAIVRISENGDSGPALTAPPKPFIDLHPTVSPDGRRFLFSRSAAGGTRELHVQPMAGGPSQRLVRDVWNISACWTTDSESVLFCAPLRGTFGVWLVSASGGEPRLVHGTSGPVHDITLSAKGDLAVYVEQNPRHDLWQVPLRDSDEPRPFIVSARVHDSPRFSPDGQRLVFYSNRSGDMQVWLANSSGAEVHPLTPGLYPSWSPDGKWLAYLHKDGLQIIAAQGGASRNIWRDPGGYLTRPVWSADGQWIYFESSRAGARDIWRVPATGANGPPARITKSGGSHPQIYQGYLYFRKRLVGIMRVPLEGGDEEIAGPDGTAFTVMPGGLYILTRERELLLVDHRTRNPRHLRTLDKANGGSTIAISPDEKYAIYAHLANAGNELMLLRNVAWR